MCGEWAQSAIHTSPRDLVRKLDQFFALTIHANKIPANHPKCLIVWIVYDVCAANWIVRAPDPLVVQDDDFPVINASIVNEAPEIAGFGIDR